MSCEQPGYIIQYFKLADPVLGVYSFTSGHKLNLFQFHNLRKSCYGGIISKLRVSRDSNYVAIVLCEIKHSQALSTDMYRHELPWVITVNTRVSNENIRNYIQGDNSNIKLSEAEGTMERNIKHQSLHLCFITTEKRGSQLTSQWNQKQQVLVMFISGVLQCSCCLKL